MVHHEQYLFKDGIFQYIFFMIKIIHNTKHSSVPRKIELEVTGTNSSLLSIFIFFIKISLIIISSEKRHLTHFAYLLKSSIDNVKMAI